MKRKIEKVIKVAIDRYKTAVDRGKPPGISIGVHQKAPGHYGMVRSAMLRPQPHHRFIGNTKQFQRIIKDPPFDILTRDAVDLDRPVHPFKNSKTIVIREI